MKSTGTIITLRDVPIGLICLMNLMNVERGDDEASNFIVFVCTTKGERVAQVLQTATVNTAVNEYLQMLFAQPVKAGNIGIIVIMKEDKWERKKKRETFVPS